MGSEKTGVHNQRTRLPNRLQMCLYSVAAWCSWRCELLTCFLVCPCRPLLMIYAVVDCDLVALEMIAHRIGLGEKSVPWLFKYHPHLIPDHWGSSAMSVLEKIMFIKEPFQQVGRPLQPLLGTA